MTHANLEKSERKALVTHMYRFHGAFSTTPHGVFTMDVLEALHEGMHTDKYACPPHKHNDPHGDVDDIKLKYGEDYIHNFIKIIRGEE